MSQGCGKDKETLAIIREYDKQKIRLYEGWLKRTFGKTKTQQELAEQLAKDGYDAHSFITEKQLSVAAVKAFGKKGRREFLAAKILGVLAENPGISLLMQTFMITKLPQNVRMGKDVKGKHKVTGPIDLNLDRFSESTLNMFLNKALNLVNLTNNSGKVSAKIGNYSSQFKVPAKLKWLDPTGAFTAIAYAVRDHAHKMSSRVNLFMSSPDFISTKGLSKEAAKIIRAAKVGMETILQKIDSLDKLSQYPSERGRKKLQKLFAATMKGWVYHKNGKFYINKDYSPRIEYYDRQTDTWIEFRKQSEKPKGVEVRNMTYESTGDIMWSFKNPVPLSSYEFINNQESFYVELNESQYKQFQKLEKQARNITEAVFEYVVPETEKSVTQLMDGLIEHYEGKFGNRKFNEYAIKQIFFYNKPTIESTDAAELQAFHPGYTVQPLGDGKFYVDLLEKLDDIERNEIGIVKETFAMTVSDGTIIANQGTFRPDEKEFRQNYWPTVYNPDVFRRMLEALRKELIQAKDEIEAELLNPKLSDLDAKLLQEALDKINSKLLHANSVLDNMDMWHMDNQSGQLMHLAADNKHLKRISNAYDIRSSRLDRGVFYDYLKNMMSSIERNNLNLALLESLRLLKKDRKLKKPKITAAESDAIRETSVNYHRTTYSSVKTTGILGDFESYTRRKNYLRYLWPPNWVRKIKDPSYSIAITPELQARFSRTFTTKLSGLFLQNFKSAITNLGGGFQNLIHHGLRITKNAIDMYNDPEYRDGIRKIIQQSAITEFSDFFSKAMVNGILQLQVEGQVAEQIMREMVLYHKRIGTYATDTDGSITGTKNKRFKYTKLLSRVKFENDVSKWLSKSGMWLNAESLAIRNMSRLKQQDVELKSRMRLYGANKLVQWAINKEYALKPLIKNRTWSEWAMLPFGSTAVAMSDLYKFVPVTMSNTEKFIRSLTFIIGAENAWKNSVNGFRNDIHWSQYTDEQDIDNIILLGREYSYYSNFGMSTQDVAQYQFGPAAPFGKFKYWNQQKWQADWDSWNEAIESMQRINKNGSQDRKFGFKAGPILKIMGNIIKPGGGRERRLTRPEIQAVRTMALTQGMSSFLWNLFMFNPLNLRHLPKALGDIIKAGQTAGYRTGISTQLRNFAVSDVMSWITIIPALAVKYLIQGSLGGDDELEDYDRSINYWLRKVPFAGFMVTWTWNGIMAFIAAMTDEEDLFVKKGESVMNIKYGRPQLGPFNFLSERLRWGSQTILETIYEAVND